MPKKFQDLRKGDLELAFSFFDRTHKGKITLPNLKRSLEAFGLRLKTRELKLLLNEDNELSFSELEELLASSTAFSAFDPIQEAFKVMDPEGQGFVTEDSLKAVFKRLDKDLSPEELAVLFKAADFDGDGKVGFDDFRSLIFSNSLKAEEECEDAVEDED